MNIGRTGKESTTGSSKRLGRWPLAPLLGFPLLLFLILPLVALCIRTPADALAHEFHQRATTQAVVLSLLSSTVAMFIIVLLGTPLAYMLAGRRSRGWALLETVVDLPIVLPPAVAGIALLMAFGRRGLLSGVLHLLHIEIAFTPIAVILAQIFVAAPYFINAAVIGFSGVRNDLREAAILDGASPFQVFRDVTLPIAWRGLVGGGALSWARALGEFGATIIFAGNFPGRTQTMPLAIYIGFEIDLEQALALATVLLGISFTLLIVIRLTLGEAAFDS